MEPFWPFVIAFTHRRKLDEEGSRPRRLRLDSRRRWERLTERWQKRSDDDRRRMRPAPPPPSYR